jgi:hypothetical protein
MTSGTPATRAAKALNRYVLGSGCLPPAAKKQNR